MSKHLPDSVKVVMYDQLDTNMKEMAGEAQGAIKHLYKERAAGRIDDEELKFRKRRYDIMLSTIRSIATRGLE